MNQQAEYYHKRAKEYEQIYQKPERQADLLKIEADFRNCLWYRLLVGKAG